MRLSDLKPAPYNPREIGKSAAEGLKASLDEFGDISGITFNQRTGHLVAGHQRVAQLRALVGRDLDLERDEGGDYWIRTEEQGDFRVRVVDWPEDREQAANVTANNPLIAGAFTKEAAAVIDGLDLDKFPDLRLEELKLDIVGPLPPDVTEDEAPSPDGVESRVKPGELWRLGEHALICGDATDPEVASRVQSEVGGSLLLMVTDPPYGVEYDPEWREGAGLSKGCSNGKVINDDRCDWHAAYGLFTGPVAYVWMSSLALGVAQQNLLKCGFIARALLIWRKQQFAISRGAYHWQHEPCWYAVRKGSSSMWCGDRKQSTVWDIANACAYGGDKDDCKTNHGTQKPVECMMRPMLNHGKKGDAVYDPFVGSGTSLIAAEQAERRCAAIDLSPQYCDIAITRWEQFTGKKARRG